MNKTILTTLSASFLFGATLVAQQPETFTANDAGFAVNSHLILGEHEAILVDAQFTRSQAKEVVKKVQASGRTLTTIFITHGHPDHYFGLEVLLAAFPQAHAVTTPEVLEDIHQSAEGKLAYWKPMYKDEVPDHVTYPEATSAKELTLEGAHYQILKIGPGESEHLAALYNAESGELFAGDLAYSGVHLWLAENRPDAWLKNLEQVQTLKLTAVYPGHGEGHAVSILDEDSRYIQFFQKVTTAPPATKESALNALKTTYPTYRLPVIAELSVGSVIK